MFNYLVVSYKPENFDELSADFNYFVGFDNKEEAIEYLEAEQYDFRTRVLYDCEDGLPNTFKEDWCWNGDDDEAEENGYFWNESIKQFVKLSEKESE